MKSETVTRNESLQEVLDLLEQSKLPFQDIVLSGNLMMKYFDDENHLIGCGGLEFHGGFGLMRSVAVAESERGKSVGKNIVYDLIRKAENKKVREVFLLTETAREFFFNVGFEDIAREELPEPIKASSEFSAVCPETAVAMIYRLY